MLELETLTHPTLPVISNLLSTLHDQQILYCHWKSNEHLGASMLGDTDLDILFDCNEKTKIEQVLWGCGFKRFDAIRQKQYKDIVDFIALDIDTGKLVHVHTHYRLTLGEPFLKGYQIKWEKLILSRRVFNAEFEIYTIDPAFEILLLFLREALKLRNRDKVMMVLANRKECNKYVLQEYHWLKKRIRDTDILELAEKLFEHYSPIYELLIGKLDRKQLKKLAPLVRHEFRKQRLHSPMVSLFLRWYREAKVILSRKLARLLSRPILSKRINPRGGRIVAVIGADGSGKSTISSNLYKTFVSKLDVYKIYFGRGDGDISWFRKILKSAKKTHSSKRGVSPTEAKAKSGWMTDVYKCIEALTVAYEKNRNLNLMLKAKRKREFVICDRYPQNQVMGYNDGPLLHHLRNSLNPLVRVAVIWEAAVYKKADRYSPDLVIKLITEAEVVEKRKPGETSLEKLEAKIEGIRQVKFGKDCRVITINTDQPLQNVLKIVRKEVWELL